LKIGGFQKLSLLDYADHLCCTLFTPGCNFRCPYCHNPELVDLENSRIEEIPLAFIMEFLESRKGFLDGVCITGGEPTLQENLDNFIEKICPMGFKIKLDTNGSRPEVLQLLLDKGLLDYVAMDVKVPLEKYRSEMGFYGDPSCIIKSIHILQNSAVEYEFRTTVVPGIHDEEDLDLIGLMLKGSKRLFLQNFRPSKHLKPELEKLHGFPQDVMEGFRNILDQYIQRVEIRY